MNNTIEQRRGSIRTDVQEFADEVADLDAWCKRSTKHIDRVDEILAEADRIVAQIRTLLGEKETR